MCTSEEKRILRESMTALRASLFSVEQSRAVMENFFTSSYFGFDSFFVYISVRTEVQTAALIEALLAAGKTVCVPRIADGKMLSVPYKEPVAGKFGIPAPADGEETACAVALTPLLAFDREGYRLGYGGGYYDRYFALHPAVHRVGLAFSGQAVETLPHDRRDIPLEAVITEKGVLRFGIS